MANKTKCQSCGKSTGGTKAETTCRGCGKVVCVECCLSFGHFKGGEHALKAPTPRTRKAKK